MIARNQRWKAVVTLASCVTLVVACGSQVPPSKFVGPGGAAANGTSTAGPVANQNSGGALPVVNGGGTGNPGLTNGGGSTKGGGSNTGGGSNNGGGGSNNGGGSHNNGGGSGGGGPVIGVRAGSCSGFKNGPGMTNSTITIANEADVSGPVPGLFKSVQAAVTAYVAYFNSTTSICGRKLKLETLDSGTSESGDQQASQTACGSAFAMVGSMGAFDAGGADTVAHCGIPDLRSASTETARQRSPVTFGAYGLSTSEIPTTAFSYFKSLGDAYKHAAFVYLDAGASSLNAKSFIAGESKMGYNFVYKQGICITCGLIPWDSYAHAMKDKGVKYVQYIGSATPYAGQLKAAMDQADFHPIFVMDPTGYSNAYTGSGSQTAGTYSFIPAPLYLNSDEISRNTGLATYIQWLQRTSGGGPDFYGIYAWCAAALFTQLAIELGGRLSRSTLIAALQGVHNFTNNGMTPPQDVGGKHTTKCMSVAQYTGGRWVRKTPYPYSCGTLVNSGVS